MSESLERQEITYGTKAAGAFALLAALLATQLPSEYLTLHNAAQVWVFVTSMASVYLISKTEGWSKWGFIAGLASEPGWMYASYMADQWGTFLLTFWWTWHWGAGALRRFRKSET